MAKYPFNEIEQKWQKYWEEHKTFHAVEDPAFPKAKRAYVLDMGYQGLAYEGVPVLPAIGRSLSFLFNALFGFTSPEAIAFPITSLGAVGAALSLVPRYLKEGLIGGNDIAVFTAIGMCWSGFLSTHTGMLDALGRRDLIGKAIGSHTVGGLAAGVFAHYLYLGLRALGWV